MSDDTDHSLGSQFSFTDLASFQQLSAITGWVPKIISTMIPSTHPKTYEIQSLTSPQLWKQSAELNSLEAGGSWAGSRPMCSNSILVHRQPGMWKHLGRRRGRGSLRKETGAGVSLLPARLLRGPRRLQHTLQGSAPPLCSFLLHRRHHP